MKHAKFLTPSAVFVLLAALFVGISAARAGDAPAPRVTVDLYGNT